MKKLFLALTITMLSHSIFAAPRAGEGVDRNLTCHSQTRSSRGFIVELIITKAPVSPQYNIRGIKLSTKAFMPGAKAKITTLKEESQTAYHAIFKTKDIEVNLDKSTFQAKMDIDDREYHCK